MKKVHIEELKKLGNWYYLDALNNTKDTLRYEYLKSLRKVHKLKNKNRILCARRKSLIKELSYDQFIDTLLFTKALYCLSSLSEQIGKNSYKIMKLRTEYRQLESYYKINGRNQ